MKNILSCPGIKALFWWHIEKETSGVPIKLPEKRRDCQMQQKPQSFTPEMEQYFESLPMHIQETIQMAGREKIQSIEELRQIAEILKDG